MVTNLTVVIYKLMLQDNSRLNVCLHFPRSECH